ncbi:MAG: MHYT domain-containing protein [Longimicrobiaceae bacterium]
MHGHHDPALVVLSVLIAILASHVALDMVGRVATSRARTRLVWLLAGSFAMGFGIWSMHFTAMLAFQLPVAIGYDLLLTGLSLAVAVGVSLLALQVAGRPIVPLWSLLPAGLLMGAAISGMHYTGMAAVRVPGRLVYDPTLVGASIGIAVTASFAALWLALRFRFTVSRAAAWWKAGAAVVMGFAISGMHYTAMAAVSFIPSSTGMAGASRASLLGSPGLTLSVILGAVVVLALALFATRADQLLHSGKREVRVTQRRGELLRGLRLLETGIAVVGVAAICGATYAVVNELRSAERHQALLHTTEVQRSRATLAHLWLEEALNGDSTIDLPREVFQNLNEAERLCRATLGEGRVQDRDIQVGTAEVCDRLHDLRTASQRRIAAGSRAGTADDTSFDSLFEDFLSKSQAIVEHHQTVLAEHRRYIAWFSGAIIALLLLFGGSLIALTNKVRRVIRADDRELGQLASIVENSQDAVVSLTPDGVIQSWNSGAERTYGHAQEQAIGASVFMLAPERTHAELRELLERIRHGERIESFETVRLRRDGTEIHVSVSASPIWDEQGSLAAVSEIVRDISERKAAEAQIRDSEAELRAVFSSMTDVILVLDAEGRYVKVAATNPSLLYRPAADLEGRTLHEVLPGEQADLFLAKIHEVIETQQTGQVEYSLDHHGSDLWFSGAVSPMGENAVVWVARDITERKQSEESLRQAKEAAEAANRAKSDFLSSMSHELRTPLNSVIGFANVLRKNKAGNLREVELGYLERVHANGTHLLGLINDVLDLSKIEAGKMEMESAPVALDSLVLETLGQLKGAVGGKDIQLRAGLPDDLASLDTDAAKLKQVVINLLGNAIKFTESGSITVSVAADPATHRPVRLDVTDTGVGIPPDRLSAIFEAFEQAESGTARRFGGSGLGLAISTSLCELMGYRLAVQSEPGVGSTFSILLAPHEATDGRASHVAAQRLALAELEQPCAVEPEVDLRGKLVLVIEDETDSRMLLTHQIEEFGCRTLSASSGEQGIRIAREFSPDLITLDLLLPGTTGWEILHALKADPLIRDIPVVVVSVIAGDNRGSVLGAVDLLDKPLDRGDLLRVLRTHLQPSAGKVLIVDDDPDAQHLLASCLRDAAAEVMTASGGKDALRILDGFTPELIVLNLLMPGMDGVELLEIVRRRGSCRNTPVVVVTAKDLSSREIRELSADTVGVLLKGERLEEDLRSIMQQLCIRETPEPADPAFASVGRSESQL